MAPLKKFSLILGDGVNHDFSFHIKTGSYTGERSLVEVLPDIEKYEVKLNDFNELKLLQNRTDAMLKRSKIAVVDRIVLPVNNQYQNSSILVAGSNVFALLCSYMIDNKDDFIRININRRDENFAHLRKKEDPLSVFQINDKNNEYYQLHMKLLEVFQQIMLSDDVVESKDLYTLFNCLLKLRQNLGAYDHAPNAEELIKKYSK